MSAGPFDAAGFVADMTAAGLVMGIMRDVPRGGETAEPPTYFIRPSRGYAGVMSKWADAMDACPEHVGRVVAVLLERRGATS